MRIPVKEATLDEALTELKKRSGRSFESLAKRLAVSKSALHRYASGDAVPARWAIVQMWAQECGATDDEMTDLERLWQSTVAGLPLPARAPAELEPAPVPPGGRARPRGLIAAGIAITLVLAGAGAYVVGEQAGGGSCERRTGVRHVDSRLAGHVWATDFVCDNRDGAVLYAEPESPQRAAVMETDRSWFVCWTAGRDSTKVWYYTRGDRAEPGTEQQWDGWGYVAGGDLGSSAHPPDGMPSCAFAR